MVGIKMVIWLSDIGGTAGIFRDGVAHEGERGRRERPRMWMAHGKGPGAQYSGLEDSC